MSLLVGIRRRCIFQRAVVLTLFASLSYSSGAWAASPSSPPWWTTRGVLVPNAEADDFALLNLGQLKNFASAAAAEMNAHLPGGAGTTINSMVAGWLNTTGSADDYGTANLGQLKAVATPFYDRLLLAGLPVDRAWTTTTTDDDDFAFVNIGQAKRAFAFGVKRPITATWPSTLGSTYTPPSPNISPPGLLSAGIPVIRNVSAYVVPNNGASNDPEDLARPDFESRWVISDYADIHHYNETSDSYYRHGTYLVSDNVEIQSTGANIPDLAPTPTGVFYNWADFGLGYHFRLAYVASRSTVSFQAPHPDYSSIGTSAYWQVGQIRYGVPIFGDGARTANYWRYASAIKQVSRHDLPHGQHSIVSRQVLNFAIPPGQEFSDIEDMRPAFTGLDRQESVVLTVGASGSPPSFSVSASDGAGPRYRKIALNGVPLTDSKPQVQSEGGELDEETYVDAFSRQLTHAVSDVYAPVDSSLLILSVRREAMADTWSERHGLRPQERADRPFGMGWSSNLCPHVKIEGGRRAIVTDEQGAASTFVFDPTTAKWIHTREEQQSVKTSRNVFAEVRNLQGVVTGYTLQKKFGTTCTYSLTSLTQSLSSDRIRGSDQATTTKFARLTTVKDRWNNELRYDYPPTPTQNVTLNPPDKTLIPSKIYDPNRSSQYISIRQEDGVVKEVRGPSGDTTVYNYITEGEGVHTRMCLASVTRGSATVQYTYDVDVEEPAEPVSANTPPDPEYHHLALATITDERGKDYEFEYEFNHGCKTYQVAGNAWQLRTQLGLPRLLSQITTPTNDVISLSGTRQLNVLQEGDLSGAVAETIVSGPCGEYTYTFGEPVAFRPIQTDPDNLDPTSMRLTISYTEMDIESDAGTEHYEFDFNQSMALKLARDVCGNETTFTYQTPPPGFTGWDDPIRETNELGDFKEFTYDPVTRVLTSIKDERGVLTEYTLDGQGRGLRTSEKVTYQSQVLRITDFTYTHNIYRGFMTSRTVRNTGGSWSAHVPKKVTLFEPDGNGRVWKETTSLGNGANLCTTYTYLGNGSKKTVTDPKGLTTTFQYQAHTLRLERVTHPDTTIKQLYYDAHGNLTTEIDESGNYTMHVYDDLNRREKTVRDTDGNHQISARATGSSLPGVNDVPEYDGDLIVETTYNSFNLPVTVKDARGLVTKFEYDTVGRRIKQIVNPGSNGQATASSLVTEYDYGDPADNAGGSIFDVSGFKPVTVTDPRGNVTTVTYDDLYRPTITTFADNSEGAMVVTTRTEYDKVGNPIESFDALNRKTTTYFDGLNRPYRVQLPSGGDVPVLNRYTYYAPSGEVWRTVNEAGDETKTWYDGVGRAVRQLGPDPATGLATAGSSPETLSAYDPNGNVLSVRDPMGGITERVYDLRNRPTHVKASYVYDAQAQQWARPETVTTYSAIGLVTTVTDPLGNTTTTSYDGALLPAKVVSPPVKIGASAITEPTIVTTSYDAGGLPELVTDARGKDTVNEYDVFGRLWKTTDPNLLLTEFGYDKAGNRTSVKDPKGNITTFVYDGQNRVLSEIRPLAGATTTTVSNVYNGMNLIESEDAEGKTTTYPTYDALNRLRVSTHPASGGRGAFTRTRTYDNLGRLLTVSESDNALAAVSYGYDRLGRVDEESSNGVEHTYEYDLSGNRTSAAYGTGRTVSSEYDALNRVVSLTENGRVTTYGYDLAGRAVTLQQGNDQFTRNTYDALGRLKFRQAYRTSAEDPFEHVCTITWLHDANGNVLDQTEYWPAEPTRPAERQTVMQYDDGNRLWKETIESTNQDTIETVYTYDSASNRETKVESLEGVVQKETTYTYNKANQLTAWVEEDGASTVLRSASLAYDENGNRETQTVTTGVVNDVTTYAWTAENRLASVTLPDTSTHSYTYDYRVRRLSRTEPAGTTAVAYSGGLSVAEYAVATATTAISNPGSSVVEYQRGPDMGGGVGGLLYSLRSGTPKFNLSNGRGDLIAQSDTDGDLTWTASYEAYGKRPIETGTNPDRQRANTKEEDPTGLLNEGFRYRDLETGVWLSRDPAGFVDGPNLYAYVRQNPWTKFDPRGLMERDSSGKLVSQLVDLGVRQSHQGLNAEFRVDQYELKTDKGNAVVAYKLNPASQAANERFKNDRGLDVSYDCHGREFGDSEYWIDNSQVQTILDDDGYKKTESPKAGDIAIYRVDGEIVHSARVESVDKDAKNVVVTGKRGAEKDLNTAPAAPGGPGNHWETPGVDVEYYHQKATSKTDEEAPKPKPKEATKAKQ